MGIRTIVVGQIACENPSQFIEPEEFCKLLLSRRRIVRCDKLGTKACRLLDETSGEVFDVEEATLDKYVEKERELVKREHRRGSRNGLICISLNNPRANTNADTSCC